MKLREMIAAALLAVAMLPAAAEEGEGALRFAVTDPVVRKECGGCHVPYPAQFLPARSWRLIVGKLDDHFGEDASVSDDARATILKYLVAHAADTSPSRVARVFARGIAPGETPLRVTSTPTWIAIHREVGPHWWADPRVKSKANCVACHGLAEQGFYGDED